MDDEEVSLFLVASFVGGPYCAAIYEIKFRVEGGESKIATVSPLMKAFSYSKEEDRGYSPVGCDISGSQMCLMASYWDLHYSFEQYQPLIFDTNTKKFSDLKWPEATKPYPLVMAVGERGFFVLAGGTMCTSVKIRSPCFERLGPFQGRDDSDCDYSSLPEYRLHRKLPRIISGYAVIHDCILICVHDFISKARTRSQATQFYYYRVGSEMENWQVIKKEKEYELYYPIYGKAEYVDGYLYTFGRSYNLIAYQVVENDGIIQSIGLPLYFRELDFKDLPVDCDPALSGCFVHLGNRIFCMMKTGFNVDPSNFQYVSILIVQLSDDMELSTLWSALCALNIENLARANLTSLCLDTQRSHEKMKYHCCPRVRMVHKDMAECQERCLKCGLDRQSKYAYKSEFWKRGPNVQTEQFEDLDVDTHMQPVNTDPPKLESVPEAELVDCFLQSLGLEKYSKLFKDKKIDKATLKLMTDDNLEALGLRMGPRKKILWALETEV